MKKLIHFIIGFFGLLLFVFPKNIYAESTVQSRLWDYQCIDTMKDSRDEARNWIHRKDVDLLISTQIKAIHDIGANCVGIATPYDEEFLPYFKKWVMHARKYKLSVWFRGNFSSWEGWFEYPKGMTSEQHIVKTKSFILNNPDLFEDGDLFTGVPEAENGGPIKIAGSHNPAPYRDLLKKEYTVTNEAFKSINKKVVTNWFSMSGGWAKSVLDSQTIKDIGGTVTLDHYVNNIDDMTSYINEFHSRGGKIVLGEFGAPIPDLNGTMTEEQQAEFIKDQLRSFYFYKNAISGISYWTLKHSSTAILNNDDTPRKVVEVLKDFYQPGIVSGIITDQFNRPLKNITVRTKDNVNSVKTNDQGEYILVFPKGNYLIVIEDSNYKPFKMNVEIERNSNIPQNIKLTQIKLDFISWILSLLSRFIHV